MHCIDERIRCSNFIVDCPLFNEFCLRFPFYTLTTSICAGIIKTDDGKTVGYGKVTNMIGEIRETELAVSMPISSSPVDDETLKRLLHLPSRLELFSGHHNKTVWKGRLPGATVNNHYYPAEKVTVVALPPLKHVVVDGYICSDKYLGDDGNCLFDRSEIVYESDKNKVANEDSQSTYTDHSNTDISSHTANKIDTDSKIVEDNDECPVCRYMKSGPCKEEFLLWDACIQSIQENEDLQKCHQITFNMMNCMRKYEHYDIMTAGTSYDKLAVLDSSNEHTADTTLTVLENTEEKNEKA